MTAMLPPLRLTGAHSLRDGALVRRSVAISGGRISAGPFPAVDLTGYIVLPGIVDLGGDYLGPYTPRDRARDALHLAAVDAARLGITTAWTTCHWDAIADNPDSACAEAMLTDWASEVDRATDLHVHLLCDVLATGQSEALMSSIRRSRVDLVSFTDCLKYKIALADSDPDGFAAWAARRGFEAETTLSSLRDAESRRSEIPRRLCKMTEAFDRIGVRYGSVADPDGETRETYAMLGAKLCVAPRAQSAISVAHAVGDPVLLPADSVMPNWDEALNGRAMIRAGKCQALVSGRHPGALLRAALELAGNDPMALASVWHLVSQSPAEVMGLADRGTIAPGLRADLTVLNPETKRIEATICDGRIAFMSGRAAARFCTAGMSYDLTAGGPDESEGSAAPAA